MHRQAFNTTSINAGEKQVYLYVFYTGHVTLLCIDTPPFPPTISDFPHAKTPIQHSLHLHENQRRHQPCLGRLFTKQPALTRSCG